MSKERDSQKRIAFVQLFAEAASSVDVPEEIHVVPTGTWSHPVYGEMEVTSADIAEFVKNFREKVRLDLPITQGHDNGMSGGELPAVGWFKDLIDRGVKGLYAVVEWTDEGKELLSQRAYKYFSPEFYEEYSDPETGERRKHVLVGGALTNRPYFKELDPVVAFSEPGLIKQLTDDMNLNDILAKKASELSSEEKAFLKAHEAELTAEQRETFKEVFASEEPAPTPEPDPTPEPEVTPTKVEASEVKISAAELAALRSQADAGAKAFAEVEKMKLGTEIDKLVFSEANKEGRILPKQKAALVELMFSLNAKQRDQLRNILGNLPKADKSIFAELGDGGAPEQSKEAIAAQVKALATEKVSASEGKLSYSKAVAQVFSEKPELKAAYDAALAAETN